MIRKYSAVLAALMGSVMAQEPRNSNAMRNFFGLGEPPDPQAVARGKTLYVATCAFCHGTSAKGGAQGPDLVRSVLVLHDEGSGKEIGPVIVNGRPEKGMPKFAMTADQVKDIAAFFLSLSQGAANRSEYKILNIVTGDAHAGEAYFGAHCASCHSPSGDLAHIAAKFQPIDLQGRFLYPQTRTFPGMGAPPPDPRAVKTVTVTGPSGTISGRLTHLDDFSVALTDSTGEHHSWLLETGVKVQIHDPLAEHAQLLKQYTNEDMHNILAYLETFK